MDMNRTDAVVLDSLKVGYNPGSNPVQILPPVSASSRSGELIALIGRNGIGKSTLLRTIAALQPPLGGRVIVKGKYIIEYSRNQIARAIGYISTEAIKVSYMKVFDLVALGRYPHTNWLGNMDHDDIRVIEDSINRTGLEGLRNRSISEISDGERQKAMIARVLAQDTEILIMDEPTAFLDVAGRYEIISLMLELTRKGKTIIFSTHDFSIAINQADKIWLILDDRLVEGSPEDLILKGVFESLFESSVVRFNSEEGSFSFRKRPVGNVCVKGEGVILKWTEKALLRAGYQLSDSNAGLVVRVPEKAGEEWILVRNGASGSFRTLYDLIRNLGI